MKHSTFNRGLHELRHYYAYNPYNHPNYYDRRNYYDPKAAVILKQHKLEVWPGYVTSIRQHEEQILLCCEISCKVLRTDTVLEQIEEIYKRTGGAGSFRPSVEKALLGAIVITRLVDLKNYNFST